MRESAHTGGERENIQKRNFKKTTMIQFIQFSKTLLIAAEGMRDRESDKKIISVDIKFEGRDMFITSDSVISLMGGCLRQASTFTL